MRILYVASSNPFNPGSGVPPPFLAGRDEDLSRFRRSLASIADGKQENLMLVGLRGTGKTVLLNEFHRTCIEEGFFPIKRPEFSSEFDDKEVFGQALRHDMSAAVASLSMAKKVAQRLESAASKIKPKSVGIPDVIHYEPSYSTKSVPFVNYIEDYLAGNWPVFQKRGYKGVILLFDEFHNMSGGNGKKTYVLTAFISAINQLQNKGIPYHLVLAGIPRLVFNVRNARSYSERMFRISVLDSLTAEDAAEAVSKPLEESPYEFDDGVIDAITRDTGRYPYFIQFYCKELIDNTGAKKIGMDEYECAKPIIIKQLDQSFFDPRIDFLTVMEKTVLLSMSKVPAQDVKFRDILAHPEIKKQSLPKYLVKLEKRGLIYNHTRGVYRFSIPMFREYLTRKFNPSQT